ncbi:MAG: hypothetical protein ABIT58_07055 [Ferruginibacter sp.]
MTDPKEKSFTPADMPVQDAYKQKEVYQHPQPADSGKPLNKDDKEQDTPKNELKENNKSSKEEGLNEINSAGTAGAFEGFEDQQR